jgi:hypothetical protein
VLNFLKEPNFNLNGLKIIQVLKTANFNLNNFIKCVKSTFGKYYEF